MSALLRQIDELLSEHSAAFSYGVDVYLIAVGDKIFTEVTLAGVVAEAWSYICGEEYDNA